VAGVYPVRRFPPVPGWSADNRCASPVGAIPSARAPSGCRGYGVESQYRIVDTPVSCYAGMLSETLAAGPKPPQYEDSRPELGHGADVAPGHRRELGQAGLGIRSQLDGRRDGDLGSVRWVECGSRYAKAESSARGVSLPDGEFFARHIGCANPDTRGSLVGCPALGRDSLR